MSKIGPLFIDKLIENTKTKEEYDIPAIRHFCSEKPDDIIIERQMLGWHIHKTDIPHSKYRVDLPDNKCPYCHRELPMTDMIQGGK